MSRVDEIRGAAKMVISALDGKRMSAAQIAEANDARALARDVVEAIRTDNQRGMLFAACTYVGNTLPLNCVPPFLDEVQKALREGGK